MVIPFQGLKISLSLSLGIAQQDHKI